MTPTHPSARLLLALLLLGQESEVIDLFSVSEEAGLTLFGALRGLSELAEQGLVSAARMRLTLSGLSLACGLAAGEGLGVKLDCAGGAFAPPGDQAQKSKTNAQTAA